MGIGGRSQDHATQWMHVYNHERPHMALGGVTPKQHLAKAAPSLYFYNRWIFGGITRGLGAGQSVSIYFTAKVVGFHLSLI
jgi:Integrase core domain